MQHKGEAREIGSVVKHDAVQGWCCMNWVLVAHKRKKSDQVWFHGGLQPRWVRDWVREVVRNNGSTYAVLTSQEPCGLGLSFLIDPVMMALDSCVSVTWHATTPAANRLARSSSMCAGDLCQAHRHLLINCLRYEQG